MSDDDARVVVRDRVRAVSPLDAREAADQADILGWIESGAPLFRTAKPATPPRHLAVYAALVDEAERSIMLVDSGRRSCGCSRAAMSMTAGMLSGA